VWLVSIGFLDCQAVNTVLSTAFQQGGVLFLHESIDKVMYCVL